MEANKIKMNMDGTIRAKVLQYKSDGNTLTEKWETLARLVDGVYYAKDRDNWDNVRYAFIFEDNGIFWYSLRAATENQFNNPKERERIINLRKNFRAYVKETAQNNGFIRSLEIEVFKRLGEDTAPLYVSREAYLKTREEEESKRAEEAERRERERKEAEERRKAEVLADGKEKLLKHERITVEQIELIAETVGYKIHIRTIGFMREKVTEAVLREDDTVTVWGYKLTSRNIDGTANVMRELYNQLKAQAEEEAEHPATPTETPRIVRVEIVRDFDKSYYANLYDANGNGYSLSEEYTDFRTLKTLCKKEYGVCLPNLSQIEFENHGRKSYAYTSTETPQISTETAETVNVSVEGENAAERAENKPIYADVVQMVKTELAKNKAMRTTWKLEFPDGTECNSSHKCTVAGCDFYEYTETRNGEEAFKDYKATECDITFYICQRLGIATTEPPQSSETPQTEECAGEYCKLAQTA